MKTFLQVVAVVLSFVLILTMTVKAEGNTLVYLPLAFRGEQAATATPTATATSTAIATVTVSPTDTPAPTATETATPATSAPERRPSGDGQSIVFQSGEAVFGWKIVLLPSGRTCDGGGCYLSVAPEGGIVTSGVVNPWPTEVDGLTPWVPN